MLVVRIPKPKTWTRSRRLAWLRYSAQCRYRTESYIDYETWCELWNTQELWSAKGRDNHELALSKIDFLEPYSRTNVAITERIQALRARKRYQLGLGPACLDPKTIIRKLT